MVRLGLVHGHGLGDSQQCADLHRAVPAGNGTLTTFGDFNAAWRNKLAEREAEEHLGPPVTSLTHAQVMVELQSYMLHKSDAPINRDPAFMERRAALWRQLDRFCVR